MGTKLSKLTNHRVFVSWAMTIIGSIMYAISVVFVLDKGEFYASGVTGISQILANKVLGLPLLKSVFLVVLNLPLFVMGWKNISKRFVWLTIASILIQTILVYVFQIVYANGFDPFAGLLKIVVDKNGNDYKSGMITLCIVGGLLCGVGEGLALKYGGSTGGMDIVAQAYSFKTGIPFGLISGAIDFVIIVLGAILGGDLSIAVYTIVRMLITVIVLDKIHTTYKTVKLTIISKHKDEIKEALLKRFPHGITIFVAEGAFSGETKYQLESVILTYELDEYRDIISNIDEHAFMYTTDIKKVMGKFIKKAIS